MNWRFLQCVQSVKKGKKSFASHSLMGTCRDCDLETSLSWPGFLKSCSQPFYKSAEERPTPKGAFSTRTSSDRFLLLPPVVPALNLMSSSKLTVHWMCWIWTAPEIKLCWIFLLHLVTHRNPHSCMSVFSIQIANQFPYQQRNKVERMASHLLTFSSNCQFAAQNERRNDLNVSLNGRN